MNFMAQAANQHMASWSLWEKRAQDVTATLRQRHCPKKPFIGQKAQLIHKKNRIPLAWTFPLHRGILNPEKGISCVVPVESSNLQAKGAGKGGHFKSIIFQGKRHINK
jgi:hypothetical protein